MSWNYRTVRRGEEIGIYSVYYGKDESIEGISVEPTFISYFSIEQIEEHLDLMKKVLQKPILDYEKAAITPDEFMVLTVKRAELVGGYVRELPHRMFRDGVLVVALSCILSEFITRKSWG